MDVKNRKIGVVGLGKSGFEAAKYLHGRGAHVYVTEAGEGREVIERSKFLIGSGVCVETGVHSEGYLSGVELVVASPGVPEDALPLKDAFRRGVPIISEVELAYSFCASRKIIAITGTNGKTTTVSMAASVLRQSGLRVVSCGNIGNPFVGELGKIDADTYVVLELSSFQLERIKSFRPIISVLLNIDIDHMDRYRSVNDYIEAKKRIFINQQPGDWALFSYDDPLCKDIAEHIRCRKAFFSVLERVPEGAFYTGNRLVCDIQGKRLEIEINRQEYRSQGDINDMMASALIGMLCGVSHKVLDEVLNQFLSLPHRMEECGSIRDVTFINDSKSTNPHSLMNALRSFEQDKKVILIMGGRNKDLAFQSVMPLIAQKVKLLLLMGEAKNAIFRELMSTNVPVRFVNDMKEAVTVGFYNAFAGDVILLSPACASFDMFANYQERGDEFKKAVSSLH